MSDWMLTLMAARHHDQRLRKNSIRDARTPQPREIFLTPWDIEVVDQYKVQYTFKSTVQLYKGPNNV